MSDVKYGVVEFVEVDWHFWLQQKPAGGLLEQQGSLLHDMYSCQACLATSRCGRYGILVWLQTKIHAGAREVAVACPAFLATVSILCTLLKQVTGTCLKKFIHWVWRSTLFWYGSDL
jgi:hypothetical protein